MGRAFAITKWQVWNAYLKVKQNGGSAGVDKESLEEFDKHYKDNLYRIWNRMSSGSYYPPAVKGVEIPKKSGGKRLLGVPTVSDRIAQAVVKDFLEPILEPIFHENSYGYRPNRSAHDALAMVRKCCWKYDWVIDFDIKGLFDNIDHGLLMKALRKHCQEPWVLLYVERWLKAPILMPDGQTVERTKGTPQGGVVSPLLANLFLHYAFDRWITDHCRGVRFCRYADDGVIHCKTLEQAKTVLDVISERFHQCGLEIHPDKTQIVYCRDEHRKESYPSRQFTFLGYTFCPRKAFDKYGRKHLNFLPAASRDAMKSMRQKIRGWHIQLMNEKELSDISNMFNPILRGWKQYYGHFHPAELNEVWKRMDEALVMWLRRKYKRFAYHKTRAWEELRNLMKFHPTAFVYWEDWNRKSHRIMGAV